jgi:isopenicillin N synthase-like dioxygenase
VRTRAGEWVDVVAPVNSLVVNVGDLMMMWSNDRWLPNRHRVTDNPPRHLPVEAGQHRISKVKASEPTHT